MSAPDLAGEMSAWETHALRSLVATMLYLVTLGVGNQDDGVYTPLGVRDACEQAWADFERQRMLAFRDRDFRLAIIRHH